MIFSKLMLKKMWFWVVVGGRESGQQLKLCVYSSSWVESRKAMSLDSSYRRGEGTKRYSYSRLNDLGRHNAVNFCDTSEMRSRISIPIDCYAVELAILPLLYLDVPRNSLIPESSLDMVTVIAAKSQYGWESRTLLVGFTNFGRVDISLIGKYRRNRNWVAVNVEELCCST